MSKPLREKRSGASPDQIKSLLRRLLSAQEEERRRISRDLHDHLGQQLTALRMNLEVFRLQSDLDPARLKQLERTQHLAEELDRSLDFLTWQLRPPSLDRLGLADALMRLTENWSERLGLSIHFRSTPEHGWRVRREVEENVYRIAQEALHNIAKHAGARHVNVSLDYQDNVLSLAVEDDGCGFDETAVHDENANHPLGLIGMEERAAFIDGYFTVKSKRGEGTLIIVRVECRVEVP